MIFLLLLFEVLGGGSKGVSSYYSYCWPLREDEGVWLEAETI